MAAVRRSLPEADLCCSICCDIFRDPVVLRCSHSFCSSCLRDYWAHRDLDLDRGRGGDRGRYCPLCRRRFDEHDDAPAVPSLTLRNLCEAYVSGGDGEQKKSPSSASAEEEEREELYNDPGEMCALHGERLKLFCLEDREPICVVCHTARQHKSHDCCPAAEAVADLKAEMKTSLSSLQEKMAEFEKMKQNYDDTATHIQEQARHVEGRMRQQFQELRDFLEAAEHDSMAALRKEEREKSAAVRRLLATAEADITSLAGDIAALQEQMALDGVPLLHKCKTRNVGRAWTPSECPAIPAGILINVAKYLGSLKHSVVLRMYRTTQYIPVTLDPNTAAPWLRLSDDLTSVSDSDDRQKLPNNPERFDRDAGVLGHNGFSTGSHWWDVEVGDNSAWVVGVASESVKRKEKVPSVQGNGYVTVYFYHDMYFAGTSPLSRLVPKSHPRRVRVTLECEKGRVVFTNAVTKTTIYTFKHAFTEKVYPYLWVGCKQCPLKIMPVEVTMKKIE